MKFRLTYPTIRIIRDSLVCCVCAYLISISSFAFAQQQTTVLVIYDQKKAYQTKLLKRIQDRLKSDQPDSGIRLEITSYRQLNDKTIQATNPDVLLSLGPDNSRQIMQLKNKRPALHALIARNQITQVMHCWPACDNFPAVQRLLLLDQPIERQLRLAKLIYPELKNIGLLLSNVSLEQQQHFNQIAQQFDLNLLYEQTEPRLLGSQIEDLAQRVDLILALADPDVYNASTIPEILLTSYRHRTPILGFSKSFVRAGAIASTVTSLDQFARQIVEILADPDAFDQTSPRLIHPAYFEVVTNRNVARSLNLRFDSDARLYAEILKHELAD